MTLRVAGLDESGCAKVCLGDAFVYSLSRGSPDCAQICSLRFLAVSMLTFLRAAMSVERNLLISLLKLTKEGSVLIESVNKEARIPSAVALELLEKLQNENLIYLKPRQRRSG